ncbi:uncharacterized protein FOMMEDRAFT_100412 [Fomitiporia mediterranea MF3/22]|uniref:uncharacterized protein n=1 Tax=Fomitiporia mediterranea (strain MF3/22) TaxID=694068 RepID=UPI000440777B|nr:uncharacterized protein FOMMEDRAFT_100412 [Fomitiporia mediterranea MF3/22]EJD07251.1 hypothetical protein FOMMEDRAFT_100412 [Fomitiporia mediterranea MF3/22]
MYTFQTYRQDWLWMKIYVFNLWLLDTIHEAALVGAIYRYLITGFGDVSRSIHLDKLLVFALLVGGFVCLMVQLIYVMRIWKLSGKNFWLAGGVGILVVGQFTATLGYFGRAVQAETFLDLQRSMLITRVVNAVSAVADAAIAACLVILLHRNRSGFKRSDTIINLLIAFAINTGLLTSLCAILGLIVGLVREDTLLFMFFYLLIVRLYMNSLLASLNSRNTLRHILTRTQSTFATSELPTYRIRSNVSHVDSIVCSSPTLEAAHPPELPSILSVKTPPTAIEQIIDGLFGEESGHSVILQDPEKVADAIPNKVEDVHNPLRN